MGAHCQRCPKEAISCEYAELGCEHVCLRKDMSNHNESQLQAHLQLVINKLKAARTLMEHNRTGAQHRKSMSSR